MKFMNILSTITLIAAVAAIAGCENKPPEDIPSAMTNQAMPNEAIEPGDVEVPAETPMEEPGDAVVETPEPEEAPAVDETPAPEEAPAVEETPAPQAAAGPATYVIMPNDVNTIGFTGYKVTGSKQGGWAEYHGTVEIPDGNIESAKINITFTMNSLFTTAQLLTETLHNDVWFNIEKFPEATFTSTNIEKTDTGYNVTGDLNIRGTSQSITFPAQVALDGDTLKAQAKFTVNRSGWGMTDTGLADDLIEDEVVIEFDVEAEKA